MNTDSLLELAVLGFAVGVTAKVFELTTSSLKKSKGFSWW